MLNVGYSPPLRALRGGEYSARVQFIHTFNRRLQLDTLSPEHA